MSGLLVLIGMALLFAVWATWDSCAEPPDAAPPFMRQGKDRF